MPSVLHLLAYWLITRFFKLKRLQWHLKNIWDEKYSRWIISLISIISNKLIITVYNWLKGKLLKSWTTVKINTLQAIIYIIKRELIIKSYFFISLLLKLFPITVTYSFVEFLATTFPWQVWALVYPQGTGIFVLLQRALVKRNHRLQLPKNNNISLLP